jgi:hypothetical protein
MDPIIDQLRGELRSDNEPYNDWEPIDPWLKNFYLADPCDPKSLSEPQSLSPNDLATVLHPDRSWILYCKTDAEGLPNFVKKTGKFSAPNIEISWAYNMESASTLRDLLSKIYGNPCFGAFEGLQLLDRTEYHKLPYGVDIEGNPPVYEIQWVD